MTTESIILPILFLIIALGLIAIWLIIDGFDKLFELLENSEKEKP